MDDDDPSQAADQINNIMLEIDGLPSPERYGFLIAFVNSLAKGMSLRNLRLLVKSVCSIQDDHPLIIETQRMLQGQLELRTQSGGKWR